VTKKKVLLKVTGSIAAYKSAHVASRLVQSDYEVQVVMSKAATQFIGIATFEGLTGKKVFSDLFEAGAAMEHIWLDRWADLILVCPASANTINKMAAGLGDDLISTLFLAHDFKKPYLIAPAMNFQMLNHPSTQSSLTRLQEMGLRILGTAEGVLACGEEGDGKLLDPDLIVEEVKRNLSIEVRLEKPRARILVTSGGTVEPIDGVRSITNTSSGKTGAVLADSFTAAGAEVFYLGAQLGEKPKNLKVHVETFKTFEDFKNKLFTQISKESFDFVVHAAAVSDYSLLNPQSTKKIDSDLEHIEIQLKKNPKLIASIQENSKNKKVQVVGFKLTKTESQDVVDKQVEKVFKNPGVRWVVHNDLNDIEAGHHFFQIYSDGKTREKVEGPKALAESLFQHLAEGI
jgi:phosphopantothenoylcysteine decarboxylase/phosphopantothenate--cysteine ligase